jgi:adenylosuccinate synthase
MNSLTGICITKLDVLDGLETIRVCVAYDYDGQELSIPPTGADAFAKCKPIYIDFPGWKESTLGVTRYEDLPVNARAYLEKLEELLETPIDIISTGPDRVETLVKRHPFE